MAKLLYRVNSSCYGSDLGVSCNLVTLDLFVFRFFQAVMKAKPPSSRDSHEMHLAEVKQFVK